VNRSHLRAALRFDGAAWRRFAELGCVYSPEWFKRAAPPVVAGILYGVAGAQRHGVLENQRAVRGPRSWLREHRDAYGVFAQFARSLTEGFEQWGPRPRPLDVRLIDAHVFEEALAEGRGLVTVTGHFGSWEIAARTLSRLERPLNMVTAHETNPSVREFVHDVRTRHGYRVIYSDHGMLAGLPILQALRRQEIVGLKLEPWGPKRGSHEVEFCGRRTRFQLGPFAVARVARAPIVPVFAVRRGIRAYDLRVGRRFDPRTPEESVRALEETVAAYEALVREVPEQWLMFQEVWPATEAGGAAAVESVRARSSVT
jgi:lauroyl/myristoyl acyltransferase